MIPPSDLISRKGIRGAASGPATERRLRGQSSGFGKRTDRTSEVTSVGGGPGGDGAAGSSAYVDVRGHVEVDTSRKGEPTQAPMGRRVAGAR